MIRVKVKAEIILTSIDPGELKPEELLLAVEQTLNDMQLLELLDANKTKVGVRFHLQEIIDDSTKLNW